MFSFIYIWLLRTIIGMLGKYLRNLRLPLETSQMGYTVFKENKTLYAHILDVRPS
jgi:hypothetical protein